MLKNEIIDLINAQKNGNKEKIKSLLLPGLGFKVEGTHLKGASRIGGYPPISTENWPAFNDKQLLCIAQISLGDISYMNDMLPKSGVLCFFISIDDIENRWPVKKGEFKVIFIEDAKELNSSGFMTIKEQIISFFEIYTFPSYQEHMITTNNLTNADLHAMEEIEFEVGSRLDDDHQLDFYERHQVLGHPNALQGTVRFWWATKYLGFKDNDLSEEEVCLARKEEDKFILLLQLNFNDPKIDIECFGEAIAYFGIHKQDLINKNFENVVLVMQNT